MGLAASAERNGFPGPKHVLELSDTLKLTKEQIHTSEGLVSRVKKEAQKLGEQIVLKEERLNDLFTAHGHVDEDEIERILKEIAALRADLRFVHLQAHIEMKEVLTPEQRRLYALLRGHEDRHQ
jgi:Spy/CpxP family protein refolding chaperone